MMDNESLPEILQAHVDETQLELLLRDYVALVEIAQVIVKPNREIGAPLIQHAGSAIDAQFLRGLFDQLRRRDIEGVRVTYHFQQSEWLDTLASDNRGIRLVRMRLPPTSGR